MFLDIFQHLLVHILLGNGGIEFRLTRLCAFLLLFGTPVDKPAASAYQREY
jgi:hypothetical protein